MGGYKHTAPLEPGEVFLPEIPKIIFISQITLITVQTSWPQDGGLQILRIWVPDCKSGTAYIVRSKFQVQRLKKLEFNPENPEIL
jgi:hypothetical protein